MFLTRKNHFASRQEPVLRHHAFVLIRPRLPLHLQASPYLECDEDALSGILDYRTKKSPRISSSPYVRLNCLTEGTGIYAYFVTLGLIWRIEEASTDIISHLRVSTMKYPRNFRTFQGFKETYRTQWEGGSKEGEAKYPKGVVMTKIDFDAA